MTQTISAPAPGLLPAVLETLLAAIDQGVEWVDALGWSMTQDQLEAAVPALARAVARLQHVELMAVAEAESRDLPARAGATTTAGWWAHVTRHTRGETGRRVHTLHRLGDRPVLAAGLRGGQVLADQGDVIARAVADLPADLVDHKVRARAEAHLVAAAAHFDARALKVQGDKILTVVAPEVGDAHEARVLEAEERAAEQACRFTAHDDGHGRTHGRFTIATRYGAILDAAIQAFTPPDPLPGDTDHPAQPVEPVLSVPQKRGRAFCELLASRTQVDVVVTMTAQTLAGGVGVATMSTGQRVSPGQARRLACAAGIIPAVLGGPGQVLDVGRKARLFSSTQKVALALRDGGCTVEGCGRPPGRCDAHHDRPWSHGGPTDLANGRLLCPRHHTLIHDPRYTAHPTPTGKIRLIMRT